jgi:hypothetical protein
MRISPQKRTVVEQTAPRARAATAEARASHSGLLRDVAAATRPEERVGALVFVGGSHACDLPVKWAQVVLRLDRTPSLWSHVALVLDWPAGAAAEAITGIEVTLDPVEREVQVPDRNGATLFRLSRYLDAARYPSLAIGIVKLPEASKKPAADKTAMPGEEVPPPRDAACRREDLKKAATDPIRSVQRFPLWDWLGHWERHVRAGGSNPLLEHVPHPAAAFCEYVYEAAGLDLTPGATAPTSCPELLWSTLLHWTESIGAATGKDAVQVWNSDFTGEAAKRAKSRPSLGDDYRQWIGDTTPTAGRKRPGKRTRGK